MVYAAVFFLVAVVCILEATLIGGIGWMLVWPALCYLGVSLAYAGVGPCIFAKRADGTLPFFVIIILSPYLLMTWLILQAHRLTVTEAPCHQVVPGLWIGRRLLLAEVPLGATCIVDVTAEFCEPAKVRSRRRYLTLPTLDGTAPPLDRLRELVERIAESRGEVVVHCGAGHGRSAVVVACVLIARGLAQDAAEATQIIKNVRPRVGLNRAQRERVDEFATGC